MLYRQSKANRGFKIGTMLNKNVDVIMPYVHHAGILITGQTQTGKSAIAMALIANYARHTNHTLIVFDSYGQWRGLQFPNQKSKDEKFGLPWLKYHQEIKFKPQDMNTKGLWISIGVGHKTASVCAKVAQNSKTKDEFINKINALANYKGLHHAIRGGLEMIGTQEHLLFDYSSTDYILREVKPSSWNIFKTSNMPDKKLYVGKILQLLLSEKQCQRLRPIVVIEEASLFCPSNEFDLSASTSALINAVTQYMRFGAIIIFICQNPSQIHPIILENIHHHFSTYCDEVKETHGLRFDYNKNYREFWWKETGRKENITFKPIDTPCDSRQNPFIR